MAKTKISEFSATAGNNTDIDGINIAENCPPSGINDAIRELMSQLKDFQTGAAGDSFNGPVGTTTAAAGAFTTLTTSSTVTHNGGTANGVAYLNGSKVLTTGSALTFDGNKLAVQSSSATANRIDLLNDNGNATLRVGYDTSNNLTITRNVGDANIYLNATQSGAAQVWQLAGSEQMRLTSTGLGVGTSSPSGKLTVAPNYALAMRTASGGYMGGLRYDTAGVEALILASANNSPIYFAVNHDVTTNQGTSSQLPSSPGMVLTSTGLGIGTSSPGYKLDVSGAAAIRAANLLYSFNSDNTNSTYIYNPGATGAGNGSIAFGISSQGEQMRLTSTGLGIGTTSPGYKLAVAGTAGSAVLNLIETGVRSWGIRAGGAATNTFDIADFTAGATRLTIDSSGNFIQSAPASPPTLSTNGTMVFNLTSNTNLRISVRGSDGVTRTANITLA